jgi:hypothetical protein
MENTCQDQQFFFAESWTPADWPPYSPNLASLNFSIRSILQVKAQATGYASRQSGGPMYVRQLPRNGNV